jgi:glycosyltransferase involved in cell wall biosynthesis
VISIIIPAHNEEQTVGDVVRGVRGALAGRGEAEVLVVDDGSTDNTAREAQLAGATVLRRPRIQKGRAVREGLAAARGDLLVLMDSDGQDVPAELPQLLAAMRSSGADLVSGSRFAGRFEKEGIAWLDYWGNRFLTGLANLAFGARLSDINASYRVWKASAIRDIAWDFAEFEVESEMILKALRAGLAIQEEPVTRQRRLGGIRKFRKIRHGTRILLTILRVRFFWSPPARPAAHPAGTKGAA